MIKERFYDRAIVIVGLSWLVSFFLGAASRSDDLYNFSGSCFVVAFVLIMIKDSVVKYEHKK